MYRRKVQVDEESNQGKDVHEYTMDNGENKLTKAPIAVKNCDCIACLFVNPLRIRIE